MAFGKQFVRPAAVPGVSSPHYLDASLAQPSVSWPDVGRSATVLAPTSLCQRRAPPLRRSVTHMLVSRKWAARCPVWSTEL